MAAKAARGHSARLLERRAQRFGMAIADLLGDLGQRQARRCQKRLCPCQPQFAKVRPGGSAMNLAVERAQCAFA